MNRAKRGDLGLRPRDFRIVELVGYATLQIGGYSTQLSGNAANGRVADVKL